MIDNSHEDITHVVADLNSALRDRGRDVFVSANRLRRGGQSAANHVSPDDVADFARELVDASDPGTADCRHVARIFDFVSEDIDYEHTGGGLTYPPDDIINNEQGNCVDQSVLLCSLLESQGFTTRLFSIKREESGHMLAGVCFNTTIQTQVWDDLADYYTGGIGGMQFYFATQIPVSENARYTILDPVYSEYPGDISGLADDGYITQKNGRWEFVNLKRTVKPKNDI